MLNFENLHHQGIWITKDGRRIKVVDLENEHLLSIWNMMVRRLKFIISDIQIEPYLNGAMPNGEHARDAFFYEFQEVLNQERVTLEHILMYPIMTHLYEEAQKRGLDVKV